MTTRERKKRRFATRETAWRAAMAAAIVSGLLVLAVSLLLIANYLQIRAIAPLDNPELLKLREQLAAAPTTDENLVAQIRAFDLLARKAFFTSRAQLRTGGWLLLGGVIVFLLSLRLTARFNPRPPFPDSPAPTASYWALWAHSRELLGFCGAACGVAALTAAYFTNLDLPTVSLASAPPETVEPSAPPEAAYPDWDEIQRNWPSFRGPGGYGVAFFATAPTDWDVETGKNIRWKTDVPLAAPNSPVVWGNRIYLSGATAESREVYCFNADDGQLVWRRALEPFPGTPATPPKIGEDTGYAAPTMAVQRDRAFAIFGNGDLVCYDADGNLKWGKNLGVPDNPYGHASSLLAYRNLLFVQYDQKKNGKLFAFDIADGREVWRVDREKPSWASPVCAPTPFGFELVVNSTVDVDAYDPLTGAPVWTLECLDGEVAPSPAYADGIFFVANEYAQATAIRFAANETAPKPEIAWQWDESLPEISSPVASKELFFLATSRAELVCLKRDAAEMAWLHEFDESFNASPILVGDRVYALDVAGIVHIVKAGPEFESVGTCSLGEAASATGAFLDGRIYFRTEKQLICVEDQDKSGT